jgi:3-hydroxybutyryl-CoA dehydratase
MVREVMYADINIGDKASMSKTVSEYDVYTFAGLSSMLDPLRFHNLTSTNAGISEQY